MLQPRPLGSTGLNVSPIGLGTVKLGRNVGVKYPTPFSIPTDPQAADLLRACQRVGITLLDTAPAYGVSEERLGRILGACGGRDRWTIVTKAGESFEQATATSTFDFAPASIVASVERSLKRLRTDRVECLLLHSDGRDEWILRESGSLDAIAKLKKQGKIRAGGISTKTPQGAALAVALGRGAGIDAVMLTLNPGALDDLPAARAAHAAGVGVFIKKALDSGRAISQAPDTPGTLDAALVLAFRDASASCVVLGTINIVHLERNADAARRVLQPASA